MKQLNNEFLKKAKSILYKNYSNNTTNNMNLLIINSILLNRKIHIVSKFKDFLLYDDALEFLKRFYKGYESSTRLKKISNYYKATSVLYPNYSPLIESKYIYSNIIKKQMVINKQENYKKRNKNNNIKKHYQEKKDNLNKDEKKFFNSIIYNEILNESHSFMSFLFEIENKNKTKDKNNKQKKEEGDKDIEDLLKIIDVIENNEGNNKKSEDINIHKNKNNKKNEETAVNITKKNKRKINYDKVNNINDYHYSNSLMLNKYKKNYKNVIKNENINKLFSEKNNNKEVSKENNNTNNNTNTNIDSQQQENYHESLNDNKIIYHRKIKSTLIGDYLNKIDLPSNSNVINMLKTANETYADNMSRNNMRHILYKNMKNSHGIELKKVSNKMIKIPKDITKKNEDSRNKKNFNKINFKGYNSQVINNSNEPTSNLSRNSKIIQKKIEIPRSIKKHNSYYGIKKRNEPISTRNCNSIISLGDNSNKNSINNINNMSNGNMLNSINYNSNNNNTGKNSIFKSYKKEEI